MSINKQSVRKKLNIFASNKVVQNYKFIIATLRNWENYTFSISTINCLSENGFVFRIFTRFLTRDIMWTKLKEKT